MPKFLARRGLSLESEADREQSVPYLLAGEMRQTPMHPLEKELAATSLPGREGQRREP